MSSDYLAIARRIPRRTNGAVQAKEAKNAQEGGHNSLTAHNTQSFPVSDWREWYQERAAIRQYEAGYRRDIAERLAYCEVIEAWCEANTAIRNRLHCAGCHKLAVGEMLDLPDGARVHWGPVQKFDCLIAYGTRRKERAVSALTTFGIVPPISWEI